MRFISKTWFICFFLLLSGCDEISSQIDSYNAIDKRLLIEVTNKEYVEDVATTLTKRFHEFPVSLFSEIKTNINSNKIEFIFIKGAPENELVQYLLNHRGELIAKAPDGTIWFESHDITNASTSHINGLYYLDLRLKKESGERLFQLSREHTGQSINIYFDKQLLTSVKTSAPLKDIIRIQANVNPKELKRVAAILRSGSIPSDINIVK